MHISPVKDQKKNYIKNRLNCSKTDMFDIKFFDYLKILKFFEIKFVGTLKSQTVARLMPCPFTGPKMFWAGPNFLRQTKNLFTYCSSHNHFVPDKKMICIQ